MARRGGAKQRFLPERLRGRDSTPTTTTPGVGDVVAEVALKPTVAPRDPAAQAELDKLLDEIEEVLDDEELARSYVQKGGQ